MYSKKPNFTRDEFLAVHIEYVIILLRDFFIFFYLRFNLIEFAKFNILKYLKRKVGLLDIKLKPFTMITFTCI